MFFSCVWRDASLSAARLFARVTIKTRATQGGNRGWKVSGSHGNFSWVWRPKLVKCFTFQIHYQTPRQRENQTCSSRNKNYTAGNTCSFGNWQACAWQTNGSHLSALAQSWRKETGSSLLWTRQNKTTRFQCWPASKDVLGWKCQ